MAHPHALTRAPHTGTAWPSNSRRTARSGTPHTRSPQSKWGHSSSEVQAQGWRQVMALPRTWRRCSQRRGVNTRSPRAQRSHSQRKGCASCTRSSRDRKALHVRRRSARSTGCFCSRRRPSEREVPLPPRREQARVLRVLVGVEEGHGGLVPRLVRRGVLGEGVEGGTGERTVEAVPEVRVVGVLEVVAARTGGPCPWWGGGSCVVVGSRRACRACPTARGGRNADGWMNRVVAASSGTSSEPGHRARSGTSPR